MRRVFTCLTSGRQRIRYPWRKAFFLEDPDCPTLVVNKRQQNNKSFVPTSPGVARDSFYFLFILFISFILLIEFNYVLTFLKDARERGAHDDCQSPLPGQVGPGLTV